MGLILMHWIHSFPRDDQYTYPNSSRLGLIVVGITSCEHLRNKVRHSGPGADKSGGKGREKTWRRSVQKDDRNGWGEKSRAFIYTRAAVRFHFLSRRESELEAWVPGWALLLASSGRWWWPRRGKEDRQIYFFFRNGYAGKKEEWISWAGGL